MPDCESLQREVEVLRQRVADLQRKLALASHGVSAPERVGELDVSLEEREELLLEAERVARLGTWVWDIASNRVYWSDGLYQILGYDLRERADPDAFYAAVHPEDRARVRGHADAGRMSGVAQQVTFRLLRRDGSVRHVHMDASFLFDEAGELRRVVGTILDNTEIHLLQEKLVQAEKMEAVGRLAAGVAHDFNNVLMVVRGNLELLRLPESYETVRAFHALDSARDLTTRLLTLGRRSQLVKRVLDLNELVQKTLPLMDRLFREQFALHAHLARTPVWVNVDETQVEQALMNLLLNAREALQAGGRVDVIVNKTALEGVEVAELSVSDDGPGIDEAIRTRIFEPFFTTKSESHGHGLGLAMVHGTVVQHGGQVTVESVRGYGTTFRLRFPLVADVFERPRRRISSTPPTSRTPCHVLVIEDQPAVGQTICQLLSCLGHEATLVTSAARAQDLLSRDMFDVILCDVMMPEMRGPALVELLSEAMPGFAQRVVFMTGNSSDQVVGIKDAGLLPKPFTLDQLDVAVARAATPRVRAG